MYLEYMLKIGKYIGSESINIEFKELCFNSLINYFDSKTVYNLLYNDKMLNSKTFNNMVLNELTGYIDRYIPKYIGNFSKANITGELYIGVDDNGLIEGIPYYGTLTPKKIAQMIYSAKVNSRGVRLIDDKEIYDDTLIDEYYSRLKFEIVHLQFFDNKDLIDDIIKSKEKLFEVEKYNDELSIAWKNYEEIYAKWIYEHNLYSDKLINILMNKEIRKELKKYVTEEFNKNHNLNKTKLNTILSFYSHTKQYYEKLVFNIESINQIIHDIYNPIVWLMKFKDYRLTQIRKSKPYPPLYRPNKNKYHMFCNNLSNFRSQLYNLNNDLNFYLIKFEIPNIENSFLEYRNPNSIKWLSKSRILTQDGPSCY